jgi:putative transposase
MPRQARLDAPGALHHVMVRGINKSAIFIDDQDRESFLERLHLNLNDSGCTVYAWTLMDNHLHLLVKSGGKGLSSLMRKQLTWYAGYFNHQYQRTGHLFENRYKSIICEEDPYLLALIRYIHLNPIRAGIVKTLEELDQYQWSGHSVILGNQKREWMDTRYVLSQFGQTIKKSRTAYRRFVKEGISQGRMPELTGGGLMRSQGGWSEVISKKRQGMVLESDERVLGGSEFVRRILAESAEEDEAQLKVRRSTKSISDIVAELSLETGLGQRELRSGSRRRKISQARAVIARRCVEELGMTHADIARVLGVSTSGIRRAALRKPENNQAQ